MSIVDIGTHIIPGQSAAGTFKAAFGMTDHLLVHKDILSCGPAPLCADLVTWERVRREFLNAFFSAGDWEWEFVGPEDLLANAVRLKEPGSIYVWVGSTVEDQLLVAFVLYLMKMTGADPSRVNLVQFAAPDHISGWCCGMGIFNPGQIRAHPAPVPLSPGLIAAYQAAWAALTADDPSLLTAICASQATNVPALSRAMKCMLRRYPSRKTGLGYWDYQLLVHARRHGPNAARIIGNVIGQSREDEPDWVGDLYLFQRLLNLGASGLPQPLLALSGPRTAMRDTRVNVTEFGLAILDGTTCAHPANPIDDWIGGVHLSSEAGRLWFLDGENLVAG